MIFSSTRYVRSHKHTSRFYFIWMAINFHISTRQGGNLQARPFVRVGQTIAQEPNLAHQPTAYFVNKILLGSLHAYLLMSLSTLLSLYSGSIE